MNIAEPNNQRLEHKNTKTNSKCNNTMIEDYLFFYTTALFVGLFLGAVGLYAWEIARKFDSKATAFLAILYWLTVHAGFLWMVATKFASYKDSAPLVIAALNLPSLLSLVLLATWKPFRRFVDQFSLTFLIETVEAIPRILVGLIFLLWWWHGRLPAYFAWVAGPGDILSGISALVATRWALRPLTKDVKTATSPSAQDLIDRWSQESISKEEVEAKLVRVYWAAGLVLFGILDFVAAPLSSLLSIAMDDIPEAMGQVPLVMVPICLVPTAFTLEIWACFQLWKLGSWLKSVKAKSP